MKKSRIAWNLLYPEENEKKRIPRYYFGHKRDDDMSPVLNLAKRFKSRASHKKKNHTNFSNSQYFGNYFGNYGSSSSAFENEKMQRVMVKMRYSQKLETHQKFLRHYMVQENKANVLEKPDLFGNDTAENYEKRMAKRHFKFIISPEKSDVPLKEFAFCFMDCLSQNLNRKFDWQAVVHTDTEHPHIHILINGKTLDGKYLPKKPFPKEFMRTRVRQMTSELLTKISGERTFEEIYASRERSVEALRWTKFDEEIRSLLSGSSILRKESISEKLNRRLSFLSRHGICEFINGSYHFDENFEEVLKISGRYNSFLLSREELKWTVPKNYSIYKADEKITGVIRKVYSMNDEDIWNNAVVIENRELEKAWYVPLFNPADKWEHHIGEEVNIESIEKRRGLFTPEITLTENKNKDAVRQMAESNSPSKKEEKDIFNESPEKHKDTGKEIL